ncbi:hypothetical protein [Nocardioides sp. InS609-2]|uniref:hypothetical protein n=1 Tax=Nocardioides sp. InS609-2 TaxID=2760705 RepID=UPI0020BEE943|nr:hypothetical protein [Nocardioides sp. InS609-2]
MQMTDVAVAVAMALVIAGIAVALAHCVVLLMLLVRKGADADPLPFPWGYTGVGLGVAFLGFYLSRGVTDGSWGAITDLSGVVLALGVASWGFGAAHIMVTTRLKRSVRWTLPLIVSLVTGLALGAASPVLIG